MTRFRFLLFLFVLFLSACTPVLDSPIDCERTPDHIECLDSDIDCDVDVDHPDCMDEPTDCTVDVTHPDCIQDPLDCTTDPTHPDCVTEPVLSCEEAGISGCLFTLAIAEADDSFTPIASYETLRPATDAMHDNEDPDVVVLWGEDVAAMKYGAINFDTKSVNETTILANLDSPYNTYLNGVYNTDGLYLSNNGIFTRGIVAGVYFEVLTSDIELIPHVQANDGYSYYQNVGGELVHVITSDIKNRGFLSMAPMDLAPSYLVEGTRYYSYDGHYFYTDVLAMAEDHRARSYEQAINATQPYYNYYQFLSFRSKTTYTAEQLNQYLAVHAPSTSILQGSGEDFLAAQETTYINAAMELAFAIHESGWGTSRIARDKNNLFGINATDSDPYGNAYSFDSIEDCIVYHVEQFLQTRYFNPTYWVSFGTHFGHKGSGMNYKYASDAYWGEKIAKHYYQLDKHFGFQDRNHHTIALLDPTALGTYGPSRTSPVVYDPTTYNHRGMILPFVLERIEGDRVALRLPLPLNDALAMDPFGRMTVTDIFYVDASDIIILNEE